MHRLLHSSFLWRFAGGFALGAIGIVTLQPAQASVDPAPPLSATR